MENKEYNHLKSLPKDILIKLLFQIEADTTERVREQTIKEIVSCNNKYNTKYYYYKFNYFLKDVIEGNKYDNIVKESARKALKVIDFCTNYLNYTEIEVQGESIYLSGRTNNEGYTYNFVAIHEKFSIRDSRIDNNTHCYNTFEDFLELQGINLINKLQTK